MNDDQTAHDISGDTEGGKEDPFLTQLIDNIDAYVTL